MYTSVYKFLMKNSHVSIPGVGNFKMERDPARFDFISKVFHPPLHKIHFSNEILPAEKLFYSFLSNEKNIDEVQAIQLFNEFAYSLKNNINNENSVELPGIGTLQNDESASISFIPLPLSQRYLHDVSAIQVLNRQASEHFITVGDEQRSSTQQLEDYLAVEVETPVADRWWIAALILAITGITAIVLYFYKNGGLS